MPLFGAETIVSSPPSSRARSSIDVSPRWRERNSRLTGVKARPVVAHLHQGAPLPSFQAHRDARRSRVAQGVVERLVGDAQDG